jgi:hypothetical protein
MAGRPPASGAAAGPSSGLTPEPAALTNSLCIPLPALNVATRRYSARTISRLASLVGWALVGWALVGWALVGWALVGWALVGWALVVEHRGSIQLHGIGRYDINYVNAADDPGRRK